VSSWTADRLPISVAPLPGEALESWIAAYARRLHATGSGLIAHLGLDGTRIAHMALRLHEHEAAALERATGVSRQALTAMTLQPHDGLAIAITPGRRALASRFPAGRFGNARTRYCPQCLARDDGRGPVTWRLPWSFACPLHQVLLLDFCPACRRPPRIWNARRLGPQTGAACTRDNPVTSARRGGCGTDLTAAGAVPLPAGGLVLAAHQHLADLMASPPGSQPAALAELREVYATAGRALRGLHAIPGQAPSAAHAVLAETGAALPWRDGAEPGDDARTAAIGATLALLALDETRPGHEELFGWILQADRSLMKNRQYVPGIGAVARRWAWCGPGMVTRVLGGLDREASLHARLRYASATPRPRWPALSAGVITRRAAMVPAMLWPGWTLRLLPRVPGGCAGDDAPLSARCGSFRRGCAGFLLLPGGPPQLNFERASPLLGSRSHVTDRDAVERIIYRGRDLTPLASVLAQLAYALDEHGSPIDYARRRALFTGPESVTLDLDAYARLRLQHGWSRSYAPRVAVMRWYLLVLLTGEHPAIPGTMKPFSWYCTGFRYSAPGPLRDFLHQQAQASLARHGITEPVTWEPPANWVTWEDWPGTEPASLAADDLAAVLAGAGSVHEAASALGLTAEQVRLCCEIAGTGPPPATANGLPVSPGRADVLSPARLRELYEHQNLPMTEIAALASCATVTVRRLLQLNGVPQRAAYRRPPPESGITREWLHREYVVKLRSIDTLARERGVCAPYLKNLARNLGLPIRRPSDFSGIGHLDLPAPPSPAMRAVTMRTGALGRLELITQIPGHDSIAAAARALYGGRDGALQQMIRKIETTAGFPIIDRSSTPLTPTDAGRELIREAHQILQAAQDQMPGGTPRSQ
jgi:TniQ protein